MVAEEVPVQLTGSDARRIAARRGRLHGALIELEEALSRPVADGAAWCGGVRDAVDHLAWTLANHVDETEGPDGLLRSVATTAPWLAPRAEQLRKDHRLLVDRTGSLLDLCHASPAPEDVRDDALRLLGELSRHRHRGADLLYDAYELDVGDGE